MKPLFLICLLLFSSSLFSQTEDNDLNTLREVVEITKKSLEGQENLLNLLVDYKKKREKFVLDPESGKLATLLVRSAIKIEKELEKEPLAHLLPEELLSEIRFFSKVGKEKK